MKQFITAVLLFLTALLNAQTIINGNLQSNELGQIFNNSGKRIKGWNATHGKPLIKGMAENTWAWMWSHSNQGEGIITYYNFEAGQTYKVSFKVRTSSNITNPIPAVMNATANVRAVSGMEIANTSYKMVAIPAESEVIWSEPIKVAFNAWQQVTVTFTPTRNNRQLWFYPLMTVLANANGGARIEMEIDDVAVTLTPNQEIFAKSQLDKKDFVASDTKKMVYKQ